LCVAGFSVLLFFASVSHLQVAASDNAPGQAALKIVVLEGEGAVNIIQQKTATAPVIEVRDQNDVPVAGAAVRFGIRSGRAVFGGARTLSVTTDAAGRAVATGFAPTGSGALQITATATFQGQAAAVTIAQTTVTTVAQAAAVSGAGASGGASGGAGAGAGAGGGGGLSGTTIGVVAGAVAGGAIVAKELVAESGTTYKGSYSGNVNTAFIPSLSFCSRTIAHAGTVQIDIEIGSDGRVIGEGEVDGTTTMVSFSGAGICAITSNTQNHGCCIPPPVVQGTTSSFTFSGSHSGGQQVSNGIASYDFAGSLNGDVVTGTFTLTSRWTDGVDRGVFPVTLQKQ
jgi:hypothetical protein